MANKSNILKHKLATGITLTTLNVQALLLDASQTTDPDRDFVSQLTGEKGFRITATGMAVVRDDSFDVVYFTADILGWNGLSVGVVDRAVLFANVAGDDAQSWIMTYHLLRVQGVAPDTQGGRLEFPPSSFGYFRLI